MNKLVSTNPTKKIVLIYIYSLDFLIALHRWSFSLHLFALLLQVLEIRPRKASLLQENNIA